MLKIGYPRRFINKAYIDLQISLPNRIRNVPNVNKISDTNYTCRTLVKNSSLNKKIINRQHLIEPNYTQLKLCSGTSNAQAAAVESQSYFRTQESDPRNHDERHLGRIYTMPAEDAKRLGATTERLPNALIPKNFLELQQLFGEHSFLIRQPALEVISYLNQIKEKESTSSVNNLRFILWGENGCGKSTSLAHIEHFCHNDGRIILNFHKFKLWFTHYKEMAYSEWNVNRIDHLGQSSTLLKDFSDYNMDKLTGLTTHNTYTWSEKEKTEAGSPLFDIVRQGLERPKFSTDCLAVLMKELQLHCKGGNCKIAIFVDGINVLFERRTNINRKLPTKRVKGPFKPEWTEESIAPDEFTVVRSIKKLLKSNHPNSVVIASVDKGDALEPAPYYPGYPRWKSRGNTRYWDTRKRIMVPDVRTNYPFALLGEDGWDCMEPFVPIEVTEYSKSEMDVMIDFYVEKRYIGEAATTTAGRAEIHFLTGRNPKDAMEFSNWW